MDYDGKDQIVSVMMVYIGARWCWCNLDYDGIATIINGILGSIMLVRV